MGTAVISGRIDEDVKERAARYIHMAGLTVGDVIKAVWESIAQTGEVPRPAGEGAGGAIHRERLEALRRVRAQMTTCPELELMDDVQMRSCVAGRYEEGFGEAHHGA